MPAFPEIVPRDERMRADITRRNRARLTVGQDPPLIRIEGQRGEYQASPGASTLPWRRRPMLQNRPG